MNNFLLVSRQQSIATITLNRPELHNAFNDGVIRQLTTILQEIETDSAIRVVMLKANGKNFCAGADLNWMQKVAHYSRDDNLEDARALAALMQTLYHLKKPTIAVIQGAALGGGAGLVACCDMAIASNDANFCFSEVKLGLVPSVISPYVIAAVGERHAKRYFLTAEKIDAHEARHIGLIHSVVNTAELMAASDKLANAVISNSPAAVAATKKLVLDIASRRIDSTVIETTIQCIADIRVSPEGQEGLNAFLKKQPPSWLTSL